jgi:hypothetical protein
MADCLSRLATRVMIPDTHGIIDLNFKLGPIFTTALVPLKMTLAIKVVKIDLKIINLLIG